MGSFSRTQNNFWHFCIFPLIFVVVEVWEADCLAGVPTNLEGIWNMHLLLYSIKLPLWDLPAYLIQLGLGAKKPAPWIFQ